MTESVMSASPGESRAPDPKHILERLEEYAEANPNATSYTLRTEEEAAMLLLAIAAVVKLVARDVDHAKDRRTIQDYARTYRQVSISGRAMDYIRELSDEDSLEIYGLTIETARIWTQ